MKAKALITALLLGSLGTSVALADDDECNVPMADWQPRDAVQAMAEERGWTVRRIKTDDGCYEIRGRDEQGREIEVKVDPGSLAIVEMEYEDDDEDDDDEYGGGQNAAPAGTAAPPENGLINNGSTPTVVVE